MNGLKSSLKKLIVRLKENMTNIFLTLSTIGLPLGFYLLVEGSEDLRWASVSLILTSVVLLVFIMLKVRVEERNEALQKEAFYGLLLQIYGKLDELGGKIDERKNKSE